MEGNSHDEREEEERGRSEGPEEGKRYSDESPKSQVRIDGLEGSRIQDPELLDSGCFRGSERSMGSMGSKWARRSA